MGVVGGKELVFEGGVAVRKGGLLAHYCIVCP
jgi:hypothetical protein